MGHEERRYNVFYARNVTLNSGFSPCLKLLFVPFASNFSRHALGYSWCENVPLRLCYTRFEFALVHKSRVALPE